VRNSASPCLLVLLQRDRENEMQLVNSQPSGQKSCSNATLTNTYNIATALGGDCMKVFEQQAIPMNGAVRRFMLVIKIVGLIFVVASGGQFK